MARLLQRYSLYLVTALALAVGVYTLVQWSSLPLLSRMIGLFFVGIVAHVWEAVAAMSESAAGGLDEFCEKIVYEYLKQFTDDPGVQDTLTFLMTREVTHYQQFTAALNELPVNFPPGQLAGDDRFQNVAFNMSNGDESVRGPWNQGQGPWPKGMEWKYVENPTSEWLGTSARENHGPQHNPEGTPEVPSEKPFTHEQHTPAG